MDSKAIRFSFFLIGCVLGAWTSPASAGTAGVVQFVAGDVRIALAAGNERPAAKGSPVSVGDTISTAKASVAQVKMGDGAIIVVQPESKLTVAEFTYSGKEDGSERAHFRLLQGGFRSVTGAIGHSNKGNYMIDTPIAHIGVRGTDHETWYFPSIASADGVSTQVGLYNRVNVGRTYIQTSTGEVEIGPNQVGYAANALDRPHLLDAMPEFFNRSIQPKNVRGQEGPTALAQGGSPAQQGATGAITGSSGSLAGFTAPRGKEGVSFGQTAVNPVISPNGATLANAGSDATFGVNWGTWQGGAATVNGRATSGPINFISSTNLTTAAQLAALPPQLVSGTATTYSYVPGSGNVTGTGSATPGSINSLLVGVNLTTQTVTNYSVNATVGTQNWTGSGSGSFTQYMSSSGIAIDGKCSGCTPGAGSPTSRGTATGAFVGSDAGGMLTSFGMKAANQSMSGTGLLSR